MTAPLLDAWYHLQDPHRVQLHRELSCLLLKIRNAVAAASFSHTYQNVSCLEHPAPSSEASLAYGKPLLAGWHGHSPQGHWEKVRETGPWLRFLLYILHLITLFYQKYLWHSRAPPNPMHLPIDPSHFSLLYQQISMKHSCLWGFLLPPHPRPVLCSWPWINRTAASWAASLPAPHHPHYSGERPGSNTGSGRKFQPRATAKP